MSTKVEHLYFDKNDFQHLAQQLEKTKRENSNLQAIIKLLQEDKTMLEEISSISRLRKVGVQHELRLENIGLRNQVQNLQNEIDKQNNELQSEIQKLREEDNNKKI